MPQTSLSRESVVKSLLKPRSKIPKQFQYLLDKSEPIPFPLEDVYVVPDKKNFLIHYSAHNMAASATPTIALHGLNGSRLLYQDLVTIVDAYYPGLPLITMDFFGHGLSSCPDGKYNLNFFVDQVVLLLNHLGIGGGVNVIGFSLGGAVAVGFAAKFPERVNKLVLISPAGFVPLAGKQGSTTDPAVPTEDEGVLTNVAAPGIPQHVKLIKYVPSFILNPVARYLFKSAFKQQPVFPADLPDALVAEHKTQLERLLWQSFVKRGTIEATMSIVKNFPLFDMQKEYAQVQQSVVGNTRPVLLIWGDADRVNPMTLVSKKIKSFFHNSSLLKIPQAGHVVISEQPTVVISSIVSFLQAPDDVWLADS